MLVLVELGRTEAEDAAPLACARKVEGGVIVRGEDLSLLPELPCLEEVEILWVQETSLADLSAFESLRRVADNLQIRRNAELVSLAGLDVLQAVEFMTVSQNERLRSGCAGKANDGFVVVGVLASSVVLVDEFGALDSRVDKAALPRSTDPFRSRASDRRPA